MNAWKRLLAAWGFAAIVFCASVPTTVLAQAPAAEGQPAEGESTGDPVPGYIGVAVLACLALFIVGKSARR